MAASASDAPVHFRTIRYIYESGLRLHMKSVTLATAAVIYHKFYRDNSVHEFDPYTIATAAIYLSGKVEEEHLKIRDVVNVCYRQIHKNKPALEMGDKFWALKDSITNCELYLLRSLSFKVVFNHPHRYLLHYLKFVQDWFEQYRWEEIPIARTAWSLLRDSYHGTVCLKYKPQHIAVSILYLSLQCHGVELPYSQQASVPWWKVFAEDITMDTIQDIMSDIMDIYDLEIGVK